MEPFLSLKHTVTTDSNMKKTFNFRFIDEPPRVLVELTNASEKILKSIEILTIFLRDRKRTAQALHKLIFDSMA